MFKISLARKCQLLFGLAVLLIIAAALFVPGYYMETFVHELHFRRARHLAMLASARLDPANEDWSQQQQALNRWWELNAGGQGLNLPVGSTPLLIKLPAQDASTVARQQTQQLAGLMVKVSDRIRLPRDRVLRWLPSPGICRMIRGVWQSLPEDTRQFIVIRGRVSLRAVARAMIAAGPQQPRLDAFQTQCVREMREDETVGDKTTSTRGTDGLMVYRYVLAVRASSSQPGGRSLLGVIDVRLPAPETAEMLVLTRILLVLAGVLAGFLAILVFYLISQRLILAPVRELTALAGRIAGGDLNARAGLATGDEFEELSDAFNDMLERLEKARVELEAANLSLDTRLGELAETNVALFESNRLKSEFLANVSHELRTPLTSIIGFADLLRDSIQSGARMDAARAARFADNILTSGRGLLDLINDLLDLAKIEARRIKLHRASFSARDVCEALTDFVRPLIDKKSLQMELVLAENLPMMNSDAGKLRQVLFNLLSNAIKYTPEGGVVSLQVAPVVNGERVSFVVHDTGPGIAPEDQESIFEKFRQLDASVTREHSGSGLGLAISKELCSLLGGTIRVESELGQGSRFIVELPVACPETVDRGLPGPF